MTDQLQLSPVEQSAQVVATLQAKLAASEQKLARNADARDEHSFAAHAEDNPKAKRALADLSGEASKIEHEIKDLKAALGEAHRRHLQAADDQARAGDRAAALEVDALFEQLTTAYRAADRALAVYANAVTAAAGLHASIRQRGCNHVASRSPFDIERRALSTMLQEAQLWRGHFEHDAVRSHSKVTSLASIAEQWHAAVRQAPNGWIAVRLGETVAAEAAE